MTLDHSFRSLESSNLLFSSCNTLLNCHFLRYFHKVPAEPPQLELKASYGLAEPIVFELPPVSEQCTAEVYATFDLTKGAKNDKVQQLITEYKHENKRKVTDD